MINAHTQKNKVAMAGAEEESAAKLQ